MMSKRKLVTINHCIFNNIKKLLHEPFRLIAGQQNFKEAIKNDVPELMNQQMTHTITTPLVQLKPKIKSRISLQNEQNIHASCITDQKEKFISNFKTDLTTADL